MSAYAADSHRHWADWLRHSLTGFDWQLLALPGRHFAWRIRGNPLSWLDAIPARAPDLVVATSMVDLATLRGLQPQLAHVPAIYYFHENQFAYPRSDRQRASLEPQMVQLYGALSAQSLVFNSAFNRASFLDGAGQLLARMPDAVPAGVVRRLAERCSICPVPVAPVGAGHKPVPPLILWNHRWDYDKNPALFATAMLQLAAGGAEFRLALLGPARGEHPAMQMLQEKLGPRIAHLGCLPRPEYTRVLAAAGIVVSTALHEFQGLSILEAASAGARPLVPDALCYPEIYPAPYRYPVGDAAALAQTLAAWLDGGLPPAVDVSAWSGDRLRPTWQARIAHSLELQA